VPAEQVWLNGELVPPERALVPVFDHGMTVGDGVFETLKAVDGMPFAIRRHLERLHHSAKGLGLDIPYDDDVLRAALVDVATAFGAPLCRVRLTITGGVSPLGSDRGESGPTVVVAAGPLDAPPPSAAVIVVPWPRNERAATAGLKTTSYAENVVALAHAKARGASEALFANIAGDLCEGTGSNVFVVLDGRVLTPPLSSGCLAGVSRALVLELTDGAEADIPMARLPDAEEVFLTSTGRDVLPVGSVNGRPIPTGPRTRDAAAAFERLIAADLDP
jgi:branched-chain amino acid aminotransferase